MYYVINVFIFQWEQGQEIIHIFLHIIGDPYNLSSFSFFLAMLETWRKLSFFLFFIILGETDLLLRE